MTVPGGVHLTLRRIRQMTIAGVIVLAVLNGADAVTTRLVLNHATSGAVEANPLAGILLAAGTLLYVKLTIVAVLGLAALWDRPRLGFLIGIWLVTGMYAAAVLSNVMLLRML
ncbi:MAG TPA: DUF5658 family protein [Acidimicrobiales bacterium]|nr:DUF5658 family protein [Acidimicrobiales bacterium]